MEKATRYTVVYTIAWICIRVFVYSTGISVAVKGAK